MDTLEQATYVARAIDTLERELRYGEMDRGLTTQSLDDLKRLFAHYREQGITWDDIDPGRFNPWQPPEIRDPRWQQEQAKLEAWNREMA